MTYSLIRCFGTKFTLQGCLLLGVLAVAAAPAVGQTIDSLPAPVRSIGEPNRIFVPVAESADPTPDHLHLLAGQQKEVDKKEPAVKKATNGKKQSLADLMRVYFDAASTPRNVIGETETYKSARKNLIDAVRDILETAEGRAIEAAKRKDEAAFQREIRVIYGTNMLVAQLATEKEYDKNKDQMNHELPYKATRDLTPDLVRQADPKRYRGDYPDVIKAIDARTPITADLIGALKANWGVRQSALNALGKINPNANVVVPVIIANLNDPVIAATRARFRQLAEGESDGDLRAKLISASDLDPRRVAAWALLDLAFYAHLLPTVAERLQTISRVVEGVNAGLNVSDSDEFVRGYCLLALTQSARSLTEYINGFAKQEIGKKREEIELNDDFVAVFDKFQAVNRKLLECAGDFRNTKIQYTALDAIEATLVARSGLVRYFREVPANQTTESRKLLIANVKKDPMQDIIDNQGRMFSMLLGGGEDLRLRRKAMTILNLMAEDLRLLDRGSEPVLDVIAFSLRNRSEDNFIRWAGVEVLDKLLFKPSDFNAQVSEDMPEKEKLQEEQRVASNKESGKILLKKMLANRIDVLVIDLLANADTNRPLNCRDARAASYPDPDLCRSAANVLIGIGEMAAVCGSEDEKKALGSKYADLFNYIFLLPTSANGYTGENRYDVETRKPVIKALVTLGGPYIVGALKAAIMALELDTDPRIRRAAAEALPSFGHAAEQAIPALTRVLAREDEDNEVLIQASASLITISSGRK